MIFGIVLLIALYIVWLLFIDGWLWKLILLVAGWIGVRMLLLTYWPGSEHTAFIFQNPPRQLGCLYRQWYLCHGTFNDQRTNMSRYFTGNGFANPRWH